MQSTMRHFPSTHLALAALAAATLLPARWAAAQPDAPPRPVEPLAPPSLRSPLGAGPPSASAVSGPVSEDIEGDEEGGALPSAEASATAVAYGQIRGGAVSLFEMKRMIERDCIARALSETRGNITRAAALLGMKRPRLSQLVKHYGLSSLFTEGS